MYNIHNYILEKKEVVSMTIDRILSDVKGDYLVNILDTTHKSISQIVEKPFYIGTNFKQIDMKLNARFLIVSAPGATGKSAFGKFLAYSKNALYWNLADLYIGDGTFQGTLYKALGASKISDYANKLQKGNTTLIIDAFDEAEIISGRRNVETFLSEANDFLENSNQLSIVLLSRTETAQNIATFFTAHEIPYRHMEIDFFPESNARDFVIKMIERKKPITRAIEACVDEYFTQVQTLINDKETLNKFLGYAPVLEAIATHISETTNTAQLISDLRDKADEISLIKKIMDNLLKREQTKFISAFKEKIKHDENKIKDWSKIYSDKEQLVRLLNYVIFGEITYSDYIISDFPEFLIDEYIERVTLFLEQHPFIQIYSKEKSEATYTEFAGPAFRDYSLARIILDDDFEESAELYYQAKRFTSHFPSQLFWNHYIDLNNNIIKSKHFSLLLEAYRSKINIGCQTYIDINQCADETVATFSVFKGKDIVDTTSIDVNVTNDIFIFNSINNMSINVDNTVKIGENDNAHITDSSIFCKELQINSKNLLINAFSPSITTICSTSPMKALVPPPLNISLNCSGEIQIDIPNIYEFPKLSRFKYTFDDTDTVDIYRFIHALRKIMSSFRTHKKDMPAKDAEKIDFLVVAGDNLKKKVLEFLIDNGVVFREEHLYKVNLERMSALGINWGGLITSNTNQLRNVYDCFCDRDNNK